MIVPWVQRVEIANALWEDSYKQVSKQVRKMAESVTQLMESASER